MDTLQILMGYTAVDISTGRIPCISYDNDVNRDKFIDILFKNTLKHYSLGSLCVSCIGKNYSYFNIMNSSILKSLDVYKKGFIPFGDEHILDLVDKAINDIELNKRVISYLFIDLSCVCSDRLQDLLHKCQYASTHMQIRIILTVKRKSMPKFKEHEIYRDYYVTETHGNLCVVTRDYWGELVKDIFD